MNYFYDVFGSSCFNLLLGFCLYVKIISIYSFLFAVFLTLYYRWNYMRLNNFPFKSRRNDEWVLKERYICLTYPHCFSRCYQVSIPNYFPSLTYLLFWTALLFYGCHEYWIRTEYIVLISKCIERKWKTLERKMETSFSVQLH